ncbi:MAG TPA: pilin [Candidatus Paceibacterota bacterium]|nr:pilin [Candidatus Paceibacterota bacterium]
MPPSNQAPSTLQGFFPWIIAFIDTYIVPLIFALAFVVFLWGVFQYFIAGGADEEKREKGKRFVAYGLVGFFVMVSVWGLVNLLVGSFGFNKSAPPVPRFGAPSSANPAPNTPTGTSGISCQTAFDCGGLACLNGFCASSNGNN